MELQDKKQIKKINMLQNYYKINNYTLQDINNVLLYIQLLKKTMIHQKEVTQ